MSKPKETIAECLAEIGKQVRRIKEINKGWQDPHPWSDKDYHLSIIEVESTGIHAGGCDEERFYSIYDGDTWPSRPLLVKRLEKIEPIVDRPKLMGIPISLKPTEPRLFSFFRKKPEDS